MKTLMLPGILLMSSLRYPVKFGLIFAIISIPLLVLSSLLVTSLGSESKFLQNERQGLRYIHAIRQPIEYLQQHRGMTAAYLNGATDFKPRIIEKRQQVNNAFKALQALDGQLGMTFGSTEKLDAIRRQWGEIEQNAFNQSAKVAIGSHIKIIADMTLLMASVANVSGITLDPSLDTNRIGAVLVKGLPALTENMGLARAVGSSIAATGSFTPESYTRLSMLTNTLTTVSVDVANDLRSAFNANALLASELKSHVDKSQLAVQSIRTLLERDLLDADAISVTSDEVFTQASQAISATYGLYDAIVPKIDAIFDQRIRSANNTLYLSVALVLVVVLATVYLFSALYISVRINISQIGDATQRISSGDLTTRIELSSKDEMRQIAKSFNNMGDQFTQVVGKLIEAADQLNGTAKEVSTISVESASSVERQHNETNQVATAIEEMTATVRSVADNAGGASDTATMVNNEAQGGKTVVEKASEAISSLAEEIERASGVIKGLEEDGEKIGTVLDVIKSIAEQTNLLALNAAIEAARAGEQGRGFAVVADEVRTLASRTHESTQEIEDMIVRLQNGTQNAVSVMESSRGQAQKGAEQARQAAQALETIAGAVETINGLNTQIATASEQQRSVADEINRNINSISELSDTAAKGAAKTKSSADKMSGLAENLRSLVGQFKVK